MKQGNRRRSPDSIADGAARLGLPLTPEALGRLARYESLLREVAAPAGFLGPREPDRVADRHVVDCLCAARALRESDRTAYDLGSGAGLPGIVVAVVRPELAIVLIEAKRRRAAFLERAVLELDLRNAVVHIGRVEDDRDRVDACFARAFAPVEASWAAARRLLRPGGRLVYFAGRHAIPPQALPDASSIESAWELETGGSLVMITRT